jgi:predicted transcriptional regulator of viral defense system
MPYRGFHVIVPPEYGRQGCLPADQFVPQLMEHLGLAYYVGLLSAAEFHGAAHQRPQVFQVVVGKNRPPIRCGSVSVKFVSRINANEIPTVRMKTPRGYLLVSSPEATAFDLVGYPEHCGGLDNVATVLHELAESIDCSRLAEIARLSPLPWTQRLGHLLELVDGKERTDSLADYVAGLAREYVQLRTGRPHSGVPRDRRWRLFVNQTVDPEL